MSTIGRVGNSCCTKRKNQKFACCAWQAKGQSSYGRRDRQSCRPEIPPSAPVRPTWQTSPRQLPQAPRPAVRQLHLPAPRPVSRIGGQPFRSFLTSSSESFISRKRTMALAITSPRQPFAQTCAIHGKDESGKIEARIAFNTAGPGCNANQAKFQGQGRIDNARALHADPAHLRIQTSLRWRPGRARPHEASFSSSIPHCSWSRSLSTPPDGQIPGQRLPQIAAVMFRKSPRILAVPRKTSASSPYPRQWRPDRRNDRPGRSLEANAPHSLRVHPGRLRPKTFFPHNTHWAGHWQRIHRRPQFPPGADANGSPGCRGQFEQHSPTPRCW